MSIELCDDGYAKEHEQHWDEARKIAVEGGDGNVGGVRGQDMERSLVRGSLEMAHYA